jgi:hypothetical protein
MNALQTVNFALGHSGTDGRTDGVTLQALKAGAVIQIAVL